MPGEVHTPVGDYSKKTVYIAGAGVVVIGGIIWYRGRNAAKDTTTSGDQSGINPATGFPYGSAEDMAALAEQGTALGTPPGGSSSPYFPYGSTTPGPGVFVNNAQWSQAATDYLTNQGGGDAATILAALGKYLSGKPLNATETSIVEQAIAIEDKPPLAGPNGYPPSINTSNPVTPAPAPIPTTVMKAPGGLKATTITQTSVTLHWSPLAGTKGYQMYVNGVPYLSPIVYATGSVRNLRKGTAYTIAVAGLYPDGRFGPKASVRITTRK